MFSALDMFDRATEHALIWKLLLLTFACEIQCGGRQMKCVDTETCPYNPATLTC